MGCGEVHNMFISNELLYLIELYAKLSLNIFMAKEYWNLEKRMTCQ